jgi:hypothetical protein
LDKMVRIEKPHERENAHVVVHKYDENLQRDTVRLAEGRGMPELIGSDVGLAHLRSMADTAEAASFSDAKLGRWLGWAQCALVAADVGITLADMKALNLRHTSRRASTHCLICGRKNCYHMGCGLT